MLLMVTKITPLKARARTSVRCGPYLRGSVHSKRRLGNEMAFTTVQTLLAVCPCPSPSAKSAKEQTASGPCSRMFSGQVPSQSSFSSFSSSPTESCFSPPTSALPLCGTLWFRVAEIFVDRFHPLQSLLKSEVINLNAVPWACLSHTSGANLVSVTSFNSKPSLVW